MARTHIDDHPFESRDQSAENLASCIVATTKGDRVTVHVDDGEHTLSIYEGEVSSKGYKDAANGRGGTHVVAIDLPDRRVAVHFDREMGADWELKEPSPLLFDPKEDARLPVTGFDAGLA